MPCLSHIRATHHMGYPILDHMGYPVGNKKNAFRGLQALCLVTTSSNNEEWRQDGTLAMTAGCIIPRAPKYSCHDCGLHYPAWKTCWKHLYTEGHMRVPRKRKGKKNVLGKMNGAKAREWEERCRVAVGDTVILMEPPVYPH